MRLNVFRWWRAHKLGLKTGMTASDCYAAAGCVSADHCTGDVASCGDVECLVCGMRLCFWHEPLHFHHDGCPACESMRTRFEMVTAIVDTMMTQVPLYSLLKFKAACQYDIGAANFDDRMILIVKVPKEVTGLEGILETETVFTFSRWDYGALQAQLERMLLRMARSLANHLKGHKIMQGKT